MHLTNYSITKHDEARPAVLRRPFALLRRSLSGLFPLLGSITKHDEVQQAAPTPTSHCCNDRSAGAVDGRAAAAASFSACSQSLYSFPCEQAFVHSEDGEDGTKRTLSSVRSAVRTTQRLASLFCLYPCSAA